MRDYSSKALFLVLLGILVIFSIFTPVYGDPITTTDDNNPIIIDPNNDNDIDDVGFYELESFLQQTPQHTDGLHDIEFTLEEYSPSHEGNGVISFITDRDLDADDEIIVTLPRYTGFGVYARLLVDNKEQYPLRPVNNYGGFVPSIQSTLVQDYHPYWPWDGELVKTLALRLAIPIGGGGITAGSHIRIELSKLITPALDAFPSICKTWSSDDNDLPEQYRPDYDSEAYQKQCCGDMVIGIVSKLLQVIIRLPILHCPHFPDHGKQEKIPKFCLAVDSDTPFTEWQERVCCQYSYFADIQTREFDPRCIRQYCLRLNYQQADLMPSQREYDSRCCQYQHPLDMARHPDECPLCSPGNMDLNTCCLREDLRPTLQCAAVVCNCDEWNPSQCCPFPSFRDNEWAIPGACYESCAQEAFFNEYPGYCCTYHPTIVPDERVCLCENNTFVPLYCCGLGFYDGDPRCVGEGEEEPSCPYDDEDDCGCGCDDDDYGCGCDCGCDCDDGCGCDVVEQPCLIGPCGMRIDHITTVNEMDVDNVRSGINTDIYAGIDTDVVLGGRHGRRIGLNFGKPRKPTQDPDTKPPPGDEDSGDGGHQPPPGDGDSDDGKGGIIHKLIGLPIKTTIIILHKAVNLIPTTLRKTEQVIAKVLSPLDAVIPSAPFNIRVQHQFIAMIDKTTGDIHMSDDHRRHTDPGMFKALGHSAEENGGVQMANTLSIPTMEAMEATGVQQAQARVVTTAAAGAGAAVAEGKVMTTLDKDDDDDNKDNSNTDDEEHLVIVYAISSRGTHQDDVLARANNHTNEIQQALAEALDIDNVSDIVIENTVYSIEEHEECHDGITNGTESDMDCGGDTCAACGIGLQCQVNRDCVSNLCEDNICVKSISNASYYTSPLGYTVTMCTTFAAIISTIAFIVFG